MGISVHNSGKASSIHPGKHGSNFGCGSLSPVKTGFAESAHMAQLSPSFIMLACSLRMSVLPGVPPLRKSDLLAHEVIVKGEAQTVADLFQPARTGIRVDTPSVSNQVAARAGALCSGSRASRGASGAI